MDDRRSEPIDYRLAPVTGAPLLRFYPAGACSAANDSDPVGMLQRMLAQYFDVSLPRVVLGCSACSLLTQFLRHRYAAGTSIGVPAFSCPELLDAILHAEMLPLTLGTDLEGRILPSAIHAAKFHGARCILWPEYFGPGGRSLPLLSLAEELDIDVLLDDAQSFPGYNKMEANSRVKWPLLLSFGATKRLAGIGGGALILPMEDLSLAGAIGKSSANEARKDHSLPIYHDLLSLLRARGIRPVRIAPIDRSQAASALQSLGAHAAQEAVRSAHYSRIRSAIYSVFGSTHCRALGNGSCVTPSTAAFSVPPAERFSFIQHLSRSKIQATWYYVPLPLAFADRVIPTESGDEALLSASIVVLPCHPRHEKRQIDFLCEEIYKFK